MRNEWIIWNGGPCPVSPDTVVDYRLDIGASQGFTQRADELDWVADSGPARITGYRVARSADGWVSWGGGECPVASNAEVEAQLRCGEVVHSTARDLTWPHAGYPQDVHIVAYRIARPDECVYHRYAIYAQVPFIITPDWTEWKADGGHLPWLTPDTIVEYFALGRDWAGPIFGPVGTMNWNCNALYRIVPAKSEPAVRHSHYFKSVKGLDYIDVYRVLDLFTVTDPCIQHAVKKLLVAGGRGAGKNIERDIQEAIDTLVRWQAMRKETDHA